MLKPVLTRNLPGGRGRVHINWTGMIWIQEGRPWGVMAQPGEAFLEWEDLAMIQDMVAEFVRMGGRRPPPGAAVML